MSHSIDEVFGSGGVFYRVWTKDGDVWEEYGSLKAAEKEYESLVRAGKKVVLDQWTGRKTDGEWDGDYQKTLRTNEAVEPSVADAVSSSITSEMVQHFTDRTKQHIALVQKAACIIAQAFPDEARDLPAQVVTHDSTKFQEPEYLPYVLLTWQYKCKNENVEFDVTPEQKQEMMVATLHHVKFNRHHPECWSTEECELDAKERDKAKKSIDASRMPAEFIQEMVCDWWAMSKEKGTNTVREWYESTRGVRWVFTLDQEQLVERLIHALEDAEIQNMLQESKEDFDALFSAADKSKQDEQYAESRAQLTYRKRKTAGLLRRAIDMYKEKMKSSFSDEDIIRILAARQQDMGKKTESVADIQDLIDIQKNDPSSKTDPYMQGLTNGLIVAQATAEDRPLEDDELISHEHSEDCDCEDIAKEVQKNIGEPVSFVVDEDGESLSESRLGRQHTMLEDWKTMADPSPGGKLTPIEPVYEDWKTGLTAAALAGTLFAMPPQAAAKTAIDAGHGGKDPGAVSGQAYEKNINMAYAKALQDMLPGSVATREGDVYVSIGQRVRSGNASDSDAFVSFHSNSTADPVTAASGVRVLYWNSSTRGKELATGLADALGGKTVAIVAGDRGAGLLRGTKMPAVIIELGFMNNPEDLKLLQNPEHRASVVQKVAEVLKSLGYESSISEARDGLSSLIGESSVATSINFTKLVESMIPAIETKITEQVHGYEITIPGVTDHLPKQYRYTHSSDERQALRNVVIKIAQDFGVRGWKFTDTGFSVMIAPQYAPLIIKHLSKNMHLWKARLLEEPA